MYIYLNHIKHQLTLRKITPKYQTQIGSLLKHKRKVLNLTLEEGALGICSISYLSKVENNMIVPSEKYLDLFQRKYLIKDEELKSMNYQVLYDALINSFIFNEVVTEKIELNNNDYKSKLVNYLVLVNKKKYEEAIKVFDKLNMYVKNFEDKEVLLYIYATSIILKNQGRFKDAFDCLNMYDLTDRYITIEALILNEKLLLSTITHNHTYIMLNLESTLDKMINLSFYEMVHLLKFNYNKYLLSYITKESLEKRIEQMKFLNDNQKNHLLSKFHYIKNEYETAFTYIRKINHLDNDDYMLKILILNRLKDKKNLIIHFKKMPSEINPYQKLIVNLIENKINSIDNISFIREEILKTNDLPTSKDLLDFWYEEGIYILRSNNFYKEALQLGQYIIKLTNYLNAYNL